MFNRTDKTGKKNQKNKGFSLVELIVVIAIMAVLVAVLAPQFTKYIDKSRQSNDAATVSGIVTAAQVGIADTTNGVAAGTYTFTLKADGTTLSASDGVDKTKMENAVVAACGELSKLKITSSTWENGENNEVVVTIKYLNGAVTVEYSADFAAYVGNTTTQQNSND